MSNDRRSSTAGLRIFGDALDPDEISQILGHEPSKAWRKGDLFDGKYLKKTGGWIIKVSERDPEDLNGQIRELLDSLNPDVKIWSSLTKNFDVSLFCGFFMAKSNEVLEVSTGTMKALGDRGIKLYLDIYDPLEEEAKGQ